MKRRNFITQGLASSAILYAGKGSLLAESMAQSFDLSKVRKASEQFFESIRDTGTGYGAYRSGPGKRTDLYSSLDIALAKHIYGVNLQTTLSDEQRKQWIAHINSYATYFHAYPGDGGYTDTFGHSELHANGMVIGALGVLGGKQKYPNQLYNDFNTVENVEQYLDTKIDWERQWSASHQFWGGLICYSLSSKCTPEWRNTVFNWLARNIDEQTGWWRKGVTHADRHQPLGGSVHILPIYQHHNKAFPYPEKVIDSTLQLQLPNNRWLQYDSIHCMTYLDMDAVYALAYCKTLVPNYRKQDIAQAVNKYADTCIQYYNNYTQRIFNEMHPHRILACISTFGILQQLLPERFIDDRTWTDIFSDKKLHATDAVEVFA